MVDALEDVVDMVVHYRHSVKLIFCCGGGAFIVVIELHGAWIKATETSIRGEFVGSGACGIIGKFCER